MNGLSIANSKTKRVAVVAMYDKDGIVDSYLKYYIEKLNEICCTVILVVNGMINDEGYQKMSSLVERIIIRENEGYDFGAYRDAINTLGINYFEQYDQLILSNDTNFGPIIPFKEFINDELNQYDAVVMGKVELEWYITVDGYFLLINNKSMRSILNYICSKCSFNMTKGDVVAKFESGLYIFFEDNGYNYKVLYDTHNIDLYKAPHQPLIEVNFPFVKKRCFEPGKFNEDNCIAMLRYVKNNTTYDISYILETAFRKYGIKFDCEDIINKEINPSNVFFTVFLSTTIEKIANLMNQTVDIFIYGTGMYAYMIWRSFHCKIRFTGFVVSDSHYSFHKYEGLNVYRISEIDLDKSKVIVAMNYQHSKEIYDKYGNNKNLLYLMNMDN